MVWKDYYQVLRVTPANTKEIIASDMSIFDATLFVKWWFLDNPDSENGLEIRRQPQYYKEERE